jgi:hypothetical protein
MNVAYKPSGEKSFRSIHDLYHDRYLSGGRRLHDARQLDLGARVMLERSTILPSLSRAKVLLDLLDLCRKGGQVHGDAERQRVFDVFGLLMDCYQLIVDDLLVIFAFEIHAKAVLLKAGYVIHQIRKPKALRSLQSESPIHIRTVQASSKRGEEVGFQPHSLGIDLLLREKYLQHYPLPSGGAAAIAEVRKRRNTIHFVEPYVWAVDRSLIQLVEHLESAISPIRVQRRSTKRHRA